MQDVQDQVALTHYQDSSVVHVDVNLLKVWRGDSLSEDLEGELILTPWVFQGAQG